jgi:hypothetical protein
MRSMEQMSVPTLKGKGKGRGIVIDFVCVSALFTRRGGEGGKVTRLMPHFLGGELGPLYRGLQHAN